MGKSCPKILVAASSRNPLVVELQRTPHRTKIYFPISICTLPTISFTYLFTFILYCSSSSSCLSCVSNYYLYNGQCLTSCSASYYADNSTNQCLSCDMTICLTCTLSASNCLTCNTNYFMHNSSCISTCPSGYYPNSVKGTCDSCPFPCSTCTNYTFCSSCLTSYYLFSNRCFSSCPVNYYPDNSSLCQSCSANCQTCTSSTVCT